jgi:hypothetical protein
MALLRRFAVLFRVSMFGSIPEGLYPMGSVLDPFAVTFLIAEVVP